MVNASKERPWNYGGITVTLHLTPEVVMLQQDGNAIHLWCNAPAATEWGAFEVWHRRDPRAS